MLTEKDYEKIKDVNIFVYASGKTGTMTLYHSFNNLYNETIKSLHIHYEAHFLHYGVKPTAREIILHNMKNHDNIYIIDSYREPIERGIASFFQHLNIYIPEWSTMSIDELINKFNEMKCYTYDTYHSYHESFSIFGLSTDIKYDFERGYYMTKYENVTFLKLRLKDSHMWENIIQKNIDPKFKLINSNIGELKGEEGKIYKLFKEKYKIPKEYLEQLKDPLDVSNIEMKKMMSEKEIEDYFNCWYSKSF